MGFWDIITDAIKGVPESAALRERLALAADQYAILEGKASDFEAEKKRLHLALRKAEEKIRHLEKQLSAHHSQHLDETGVQILILIAHHPDCTTETLAQHLGLHPEKIRYYRDELAQHGYVDYGFTWRDEEYYQLTPKGRKVLNDRQLL